MVAKQISTGLLPRSRYEDFAKKAKEFYNVMQICLQDREWNAVLLNGVHAAISQNDAVTVYHLGQQSKSKDHRDAASLLIQSLPNADGKKSAARLIDIINEKNLIEYAPKLFSEKEAHAFAQKVERFFLWAQGVLPKS